MWKYIVAFVLFAGLSIWLLTKSGGDIDLGGEKHEIPAASNEKDAAPKK